MIKPRQEASNVIELVDAGQLIRFHDAQRNRRHGSADDIHDPLAGLITGPWWRRRRRRLLDLHRSANRDRRDRLSGNDRDRRLHCLHRRKAGQDGLGRAGPCRGVLAAVGNQLQVPRRRPGVG